MNIGVHVSLSDLVSSVCMPRSGIAGDTSLIPGTGRSPGEGIGYPLQYSWASLETQLIENPPAMWESWVRSLGWEDSLEEGMATHTSILVWRTPWTEDPGVLQSVGLQSWTWLSDWTTYILYTCPTLCDPKDCSPPGSFLSEGKNTGVPFSNITYTCLKYSTGYVCSLTQLCPTLCDPMDCSPPGSSVHGNF